MAIGVVGPNAMVWPSGAAAASVAEAERAGGAVAVEHDDVLARPAARSLRQRAADHVDAAAGGKRDDHLDLPRRPALREPAAPRRCRRHRKQRRPRSIVTSVMTLLPRFDAMLGDPRHRVECVPRGLGCVRERSCGRAALGYRSRSNGRRPHMKRSTNRILTTHVGSLPRPADLLEMMDAARAGSDPKAYEQRLRAAVGGDRAASRSSSASTSSTTANTPSRASSPISTSGWAASRPTRPAASPISGRGRARRWRFPSTTTRPPMPGRRGRRTWSAPGRSPTRATTSSSATSRTSRPRSAARSRKRRSCRRSRRRTSRTGTRTPTTRPTRNSCSRSPTRWPRNTRRSSPPASWSRSTIRGWSPTTR